MSPDAAAAVAYARTLGQTDTLTVRVAVLLELVDMAEQGGAADVEPLLTVADLARRFGVAESTARAWLHDGLAPDAVKLAGLGWRCPRESLPALQRALAKHGDTVDLGDWRRQHRGAA